MQIEVIDSEIGLHALEPEWRDLSARAGPANYFLRYDWMEEAWRRVASHKGRGLRVIVGRVRGRVVLIWPLVQDGRYLRFLSSGMVEYRDVLVEPCPEASEWVAQAWVAACRMPGAHCLLLQDLRDDSHLARLLGRQGASGLMTTQPSRCIQLGAFRTADDYMRHLPKSLQADQRRQWRRLHALPGKPRFARVESDDDVLHMLEWLFEHKVRWIEARGLGTGGFRSAAYRDFLTVVCLNASVSGELVAVGLRSGDRMISAGFGFQTQAGFLFYMFAYDADWASYSPSRLLQERLIQLCIESGMMVFDFMPGETAYKEKWTNDEIGVCDYLVPLTTFGRGLAYWHGSDLILAMEGGWIQRVYRCLPRRVRRPIANRLLNLHEYAGRLRPFGRQADRPR